MVLCILWLLLLKTEAINRKNKMCVKYKTPATKTEYAPDIKYALINKMRLLSGVYGMVSEVKRTFERIMTSNLCKPPKPLRLTGNNSWNWREFKEQLQWFLAGTESTDKPDTAKIDIMLSHAGKNAWEVYKTLSWSAEGVDKNLTKC